jgi:Na+/H+ antiporter NhaD/arsenite permease-like protein
MVSQIVALVIFVLMFAVIISGKVERHIPALIGAVLTLTVVFGICMHSGKAVWETLNLACFAEKTFWYSPGIQNESSVGINWSTIIFFLGMMILVEGMGMSGFFRWLCLRLAKAVRYRVIPLFLSFMFISAFLAMFIDSITVILFMAAITVELSQILKFNPVYMILPEIFCANLGGAATMSGDPPNIIVGTSLGLTFIDFVKNTGLIVWISMIVIMVYFYICFGRKLNTGEKVVVTEKLDPKYAIADLPRFAASIIEFLIVVVLLITHAQTGITVASIGVIAAVLTFIIFVRNNRAILKKVDWNTVLFFVGLFVVVGGLEQTGILNLLAGFIGKVSGGNAMVMVAVILWISAIASAVVDNIPFAATMVPVIRMLSATHVSIHLETLAWALSLGTDIGGNATPIGASANVVGTSIADKNGHHISWGTYCKYSIPATVIVLVICTIYLFMRYL